MDDSIFILIMLAGFIGGFVDSAVGGGGLIRLPALLAAGLPSHVALATNKFGSTWAAGCLLYTSPSPRDGLLSRMPSSA